MAQQAEERMSSTMNPNVVSAAQFWGLIDTARSLALLLDLPPEDRRRAAASLMEGGFDEGVLPLDAWPSGPDLTAEAAELQAAKSRFASRLKQLLGERGMSQADLAASLEVSAATVSSYLSGRHKPQSRTLHRIAEVLGCAVADLWS